MKAAISALLVAIGFLTRIPVPARVFDDADAQRSSLVWYPAVGLLLGIILLVLAGVLHDAPPLLLAALLLAAWVLLTGGLHLDGLADTADAWIGGLGNRERTLEIMKDPRSGPAGVTAVVLVLLLKFAALASLSTEGWPLLWLAPLLARAGLTAAFLGLPYVRSGGLGSALADAPRGACMVSLLATLALSLIAGLAGILALLAASAIWLIWRRACRQRLGGFTGDTAGALAEVIEMAALVALALGGAR